MEDDGYKALKISCIKKLICNVNYQTDWKRLLLPSLDPLLGRCLVNKNSLSVLASSFGENTFCRNVVESWAEYVNEPAEASYLLSQPLWNNVFTNPFTTSGHL